MTVRRLTTKQRGPRCSYCRERAVYRGLMHTRFACGDHLPLLEAQDARQTRLDRLDEGKGYPWAP